LFFDSAGGSEAWELVLLAGSLDSRVEGTLKAQEPAFIAKYCFEMAQAFNNFYHKHHILSEQDENRKSFLLALCMMVQAQLEKALGLLGINSPERM
jgi:arginyl-tRNA synthetase